MFLTGPGGRGEALTSADLALIRSHETLFGGKSPWGGAGGFLDVFSWLPKHREIKSKQGYFIFAVLFQIPARV